jgi:flagellar biosynthetic protein FliR
VEQVPLGTGVVDGRLDVLLGYIGSIFVLAFGAAGLIILTLFIVDMAIAFMSRTLPQMNVLLLGFQVKTLVVLAVLPIAVALSAGLLLRLLRAALESMAMLA